MKKNAFALAGLLIVVLLSLSGCADFAFNPIGRWTYTEERTYIDDVLTASIPADKGFDTALVFTKSGTGYIDTGASDHLPFTYEYTDTTVTITRTSMNNVTSPSVFQVRDNGHELVSVIQEYDSQDEHGQTRHCRVETVFKR